MRVIGILTIMLFLLSLVLVRFFITTSHVVLVEAENAEMNYDTLIKSIHDTYGTAEIIIVAAESSQGGESPFRANIFIYQKDSRGLHLKFFNNTVE